MRINSYRCMYRHKKVHVDACRFVSMLCMVGCKCSGQTVEWPSTGELIVVS